MVSSAIDSLAASSATLCRLMASSSDDHAVAAVGDWGREFGHPLEALSTRRLQMVSGLERRTGSQGSWTVFCRKPVSQHASVRANAQFNVFRQFT